jgi:hypothetical protein
MIYGAPLALFEVLAALKAPTTQVSVSLVPAMRIAHYAPFRAMLQLQLLHLLPASISLIPQASLSRQLPG